MSRSDDYITVAGLLLELREKSVRLDSEFLGVPVWLPLWSVDSSDARALAKVAIGDKVSIRVLGDMAEAKGLV